MQSETVQMSSMPDDVMLLRNIDVKHCGAQYDLSAARQLSCYAAIGQISAINNVTVTL